MCLVCDTQTQVAFAMSDEGPIEESILHAARRLGYHDLREQQLHAAKKFLQGNDVFVSLPTYLPTAHLSTRHVWLCF